MGRTSKKRQVEEDAVSSDDDIKPNKKVKTKTTSEDNPGKDGDGNSFWPLSTTRRITIQGFKGKTLVNIREYYEANGELRPGKKGISLPLEQYNALLTAIPAINAELASKGHEVPDIFANPTSTSNTSSSKPAAKSPSKEQKRKKKKMNIEATSDEESESG